MSRLSHFKSTCVSIFFSTFLMIDAFQSAQAIEVRYFPENDQFILTNATCYELQAEVKAMRKWTRARQENPPKLAIDCSQTPYLTTIDITPILPSQAKAIYGNAGLCSGPNCLNTVLLDLGLNQYKRYVGPGEWSSYLNLNCKKKRFNQIPRPGDVGVIRRRTGMISTEIVHAFIYIRSLALSKNGFATSEPIEFQPWLSILHGYMGTNFKNCINPVSEIFNRCENYLNFYTCQNNNRLGDNTDLHLLESRISSSTSNRDFSYLREIQSQFDPLFESTTSYFFSDPLLTGTLKSFHTQLQELQFEQKYQNLLNENFHPASITDADLNFSNQSLIYVATQRKDLERLRFLLSQSHMNPNLEDSSGDTALLFAAQNGLTQFVSELLNRDDINPNHLNQSGYTPLTAALEYGHFQIAKMLLEKGSADPRVVTPTRESRLNLENQLSPYDAEK